MKRREFITLLWRRGRGHGQRPCAQDADWAFAQEGIPHTLKNTGSEPMIVLAVVIGTKGARLTRALKR